MFSGTSGYYGISFTFTVKPTWIAMTTNTAGKINSRRILRYFIQGILILAPIAITGYVLYWLFDRVDGILRPVVNIPGLGFFIILFFVLLVGYVSTNFLMGSILHLFDSWLERTPGVKFIYTSTKDFFEAFAGDKRKFDKPILVNVMAEEVWMVAFLTNEDLHRFDLGAEYVSAYVPQGYNIAGQLYFVKRERIRKLDHLSASMAMKFAVTGGVVKMEEAKETIVKAKK